MNRVMRVIHAVPLFVFMVIQSYRFDGIKLVASLTHWWRQEVYTITDYKKYLICEDIEIFSGWYGPKRRYNHTKHSEEKLQDVLFEVEQELRRRATLEVNGFSTKRILGYVMSKS